MQKWIKNITGSSLLVGGIEIPAGGYFELTGPNVQKFAQSPKVIDMLTNDQILMSLDGSTTLSKSDSKIILESFTSASRVSFDDSTANLGVFSTQAAIENLLVSPVGALDTYVFSESGSARNQWLEYGIRSIPSDETPAVLPFSAKLIACVFSNDDDGTDTDIEVYRSVQGSGSTTSRAVTFQVRNKRVARFSNFTPIQFAVGDKIGVYMRDKGTNPSDVAVKLYFLVSAFTKENAGEDYSSDLNLSSGGIIVQ